MGYQILADGVIIHDPRMIEDKRIVLNPTLDMSVDFSPDRLTFTMLPNHPAYDDLKRLTTTVTVLQDGKEIFRGRIIDGSRDFNLRKTVTCESEIAYLCDTVMRPFGYKGTVAGLLNMIVAGHNGQQPDARKKFSVGMVTVTDSNDFVVRSSSKAVSSFEAIRTKLVDMLGGYIRIRREGSTNYIDYLADFPDRSGQTIRFGQNLLDFGDYVDATELYTVLRPYGAELNSGEVAPENGYWSGDRLILPEGFVTNTAAVAVYGYIWRTKTWDNVTVVDNLRARARDDVNAAAMASTVTIRAFDLHLVDVDTEALRVGTYVPVFSAPHGVNVEMLCSSMRMRLDQPARTTINLGLTRKSLTEMI